MRGDILWMVQLAPPHMLKVTQLKMSNMKRKKKKIRPERLNDCFNTLSFCPLEGSSSALHCSTHWGTFTWALTNYRRPVCVCLTIVKCNFAI